MQPCTIAVYDTTAETDTLTATSNANGSVVATSTLTFTASPTPLAAHPRFLMTPANLSAMQTKATPTNPMYQNMLSGGINAYNADNAIWSWTCNGGTGQPSSNQVNNVKEYDAYNFALLALLDPSDPVYKWKCYAHDVSLYLFTQYQLIGPNYFFPQGANQWSDMSYIWATLGDWLRGSGAVTSSGDLATMRAFYSYLMVASYAGANYPNPANTYNSAGMLLGNVNGGAPVGPGPADMQNARVQSGNNYSLSRMLLTAAAGLTFDDNPSDAPNIPTGVYNTCGATRYQMCADGSAGSLIAYWKYLDGAMLYNYWGHIEDPSVVQQAYNSAYGNLPTQPQCEGLDLQMHPCFGDGRDGGSSEGNYYNYSMYRMRWLLNMLHTAGVDDPLVNGPQMSAGFSSWWDMKYVHDLETLTGPTQEAWSNTYGEFIARPAYNPLSMGDEFTYFSPVSSAWTEAAMLTFDSETGRTDRASALKWINFNLAFGGPLGTSNGCTDHCGWLDNMAGGYGGGTIIDMFFALPAGNPVGGALPPDPRPSLPTDLYDGSLNQNGLVRTSWSTSNSSLMAYWFNNSQITHEYNYDGRFDIYSCLSGTCDYVTKGRAIFNDYNWYMVAANMQNELGIFNSTGSNPNYQWYQMYLNGGQFPQGDTREFVTSTHSELPTYAAVIGDTTGAYNGTPTDGTLETFSDVQSASRSIVYLRGTNQVVYYDRAAVGHAASTQSLQQVTTGTPTISGNTANWLTRSTTQRAYYTNLLPSGGTLTNLGLPCTYCSTAYQPTDWEPAAILQITPPGKPTSSQFLSVLEWGSSGFSKTSTTLVQSTSGNNFDGALVGSSLVMFMRNWPAAFTSVTYPASGATTHYISDLTPNTTYNVSGAGAPNTATTDTAGVLVFAATGTGEITVGTGSAPNLQTIAVTPSVSSLQALATEQYSAACTYSDGSSTDCTSSVAWSSSARGVVTVNSTGVATGVAQGSATIIAASGGIQGQATVTVPAPVLQTITVTPGTLAATSGSTQQFKATALYSDSSSTDVTDHVSWSSGDPAILAPNSTGMVSTMSPGNATVIAASGGVTGIATVTVSPVVAPTFSPTGGTYFSAQTVTLSTATPSATIYYTTNGAIPTIGSMVYSSPITVNASETVIAIAVANGTSTSQVSSANSSPCRQRPRPLALRVGRIPAHKRLPSAQQPHRRQSTTPPMDRHRPPVRLYIPAQ